MFELFERAANLGNVSSMVEVAHCRLNGIGCDRSKEEAREWLEKARLLEVCYSFLVLVIFISKIVVSDGFLLLGPLL